MTIRRAANRGLFAGAVAFAALALGAQFAEAQQMREIDFDTLRDKIRGGMAGQMVGVTYGAPTEFRWLGKMVEGEIGWTPEQVRGSLNQDDLYVEMTFAAVMDEFGLDATTEQYGDAFRRSKYNLWHANAGARRLLNNGIKAPMSGHPKHNMHANDIDFQIEADFIGLMTPGMPQEAVKLCDIVGRVMNFGDGVYGGMFVTGMYAEAFFTSDIRTLVEVGAECMPEGSKYRAIIKDVLAAYDEQREDWKICWKKINAKWDKYDSCPDGSLSPFNIDASLNGAYIAIGMLYGEGDFDRTLEISTRCGQDSDCNPASAAGVLGVISGYKAMDAKWIGGIPEMEDEKFSFTNYSFNEFNASTERRIRAVVARAGGEVRENSLAIPRAAISPPPLEQWSMGIPTKSVAHDDSSWTWTGDWQVQEGRSYRMRPARYSEGGGNEATLKFEGSAIAIVGNMNGRGGMADVYIDGEKAGEINGYIIPNTTDSNLFHAYGLKDGAHELRIVTLDRRDDRSEGNRIDIGRAIVYGPEE